jgi:eukaryotic-like serine/threonine-protein kinase
MAPPVVERILSSLRDSGDFPAMERTVSRVSQLASSEATSTSVLADAVLQDYGLAQKLLRLVNTAAFAQRHQVTTISRAVLLLGFERVRTVATGLILFEHLQARAKTPELVDALTMSFYSAILGRAIADQTSFADPEEAFISALFHNLGRILVALYLPAEMQAIKANTSGDHDAAVFHQLGMSYAAVGIAVANALNLPSRLARSMTRITGAQAHDSMDDEEKLGSLATLTNGITDTLASQNSTGDKRAAIGRLVRSYGPHFAAIYGTIDGLIGQAVIDLKAFSKTFRLDVPGSAFVMGLGEWWMDSLITSDRKAVAATSAAGGLIEVADSDLQADELPETTLTRGLHEITGLLIGEYTLDDVLRVILETMYRALGVGRTRAFFLLKDPGAPIVRFRFGLGQSATEMRAWLEVPINQGEDVFGLALHRQKDLVIKDSAAAEVLPLLPDWHRQLLLSRRFVVLLPLVVDQKPLGLFYIDGDHSAANVLTSAVLNYLKVLRGQAVIAIHQKSLQSGRRR